MAMGFYEPDSTRKVSELLNKGDVFYDLGANAGYYTLVAAKSVGMTGQVVAFEPVPVNAAAVREQIQLNEYQGFCSVEELAISDAVGRAEMAIPRYNANAHLVEVQAPHVKSWTEELIEINCTTLDDYIFEHSWHALIKIDIEGAEVKALLGANKVLAALKAPDFIITAHSQELASQLKVILRKFGYEIKEIRSMIFASKNWRSMSRVRSMGVTRFSALMVLAFRGLS